MPTDPFVSSDTRTAPRNEPTLAPGVVLPPSRAWRADRPGDLPGGVQPRGDLFGTPGPNVGYALLLVHRAGADFQLAPGEHREDAEAVVAAVAMKRASSFGRAPIVADVERAATLLGYRGGADPATAAQRADAVAGAHHEYGRCRQVADQVDLEVLRNV
ncbi:MAG: hypothetical protein FJW95_06815 [Actinobacteria bacterium]|nr:hypothetical protein [Actinomycetota bacterium]